MVLSLPSLSESDAEDVDEVMREILETEYRLVGSLTVRCDAFLVVRELV